MNLRVWSPAALAMNPLTVTVTRALSLLRPLCEEKNNLLSTNSYGITSPGSGNKVMKEKIIGITSSGESSGHMVAASGVQWIAVHAKKTICIVALRKMDVDSLANTFFSVKPIGDVLTDYMLAVIYKLEDGSLKGIGNMFEKTFGIVSGMRESVDEDYDEESAIKYLKEKSKRHSTFTL